MKGDHGQHGETGATGATGETGAEGKSSVLTRNVTASFWAVILVAVAVTGFFGYEINKTRDLANQNRETRAELARSVARSDRLLCVRQKNAYVALDQAYSAIDQLALGAVTLVKLPPDAPGDRVFVAAFETSRAQLAGTRAKVLQPVIDAKCSALPTERKKP